MPGFAAWSSGLSTKLRSTESPALDHLGGAFHIRDVEIQSPPSETDRERRCRPHKNIITALDGREVDITSELGRLIFIGRHYHPGDDPDPDGRKFPHRLGWGLLQG